MSLDMAVEYFKIEFEKSKKMKNCSPRISEKEKAEQEEKYLKQWEYWKHRNSHKK